MKVYTTKYALTTGIDVKEVESGGNDRKYVYTKGNPAYGFQQFVMGKTAFLTYTEAATAAREMRDKKVASLKKQLAKVSGLIFSTQEPENLK